MKWSRFKELIEEEIKKSGIVDPDISVIDVSAMSIHHDELNISVNDEDGLYVTG